MPCSRWASPIGDGVACLALPVVFVGGALCGDEDYLVVQPGAPAPSAILRPSPWQAWAGGQMLPRMYRYERRYATDLEYLVIEDSDRYRPDRIRAKHAARPHVRRTVFHCVEQVA